MPKNRNMGRKSHRVQDVQYAQNLNGLQDELGDQPTRPSTGKQPTKSTKEEPRDTK